MAGHKTTTEIIDGIPTLIHGRDIRLMNRANQPLPRKTRVAKKWLGVKVPKMELMTLRKQQRDALGHYMALGMDKSRKTEAGVAAGYSPTSASAAVSRVLAKPFVQAMIVEALEKHGVNLDTFAEVIADGLRATHPLAAPRQDENGVLHYPKDYHAIHKFTVTGLELNDAFPAKKTQLDVNKRVVTINLTADDGVAFDKFQRMRKEKQDVQADPAVTPNG